MTGIWWFAPFLPDEPDMQRLGRHCRFTAGDELLRAGPLQFSPGDSPAARLEITLECFSLDCFCWVDSSSLRPYMFVSQELREAMALDPGDVQYLPVDSSLSAPLPGAKNYMTMHVPAEDISDRERSWYINKYMPNEEGIVDDSEEPITPTCIAIRRDADLKHDIFRDNFFSKFILCTDALALRVLQKHCSGIRFVDPASLYDPLRFRTLQGIKEESWIAEQDASHTISGGRGGTELHRAGPHTDTDPICADYGEHIPGVQFAAVPLLMGSLRKTRSDLTNWERPEILSDWSLRLGSGEIITAAQLLNAVDRSRQRDAVWFAIRKLQLNPEWAVDILGARAYAWAKSFAPGNFADVPASGPFLEAVSRHIMLAERARPGTLYLALRGDWLSIECIRGAAEEGVSDPTFIES